MDDHSFRLGDRGRYSPLEQFMTTSEILQRVSHFESLCRKHTESDIGTLPSVVADSIRQKSRLLEHLYRFSCCYWGCHGREHVFEHLAGRCVSSLIAAERLTTMGYYDECMSLIRSVGEIANLLNMFMFDHTKIRQWLDCSEKERRREFKPYKVREFLEKDDFLVPFTGDHYGRLCERLSLIHI